MRDGWGNVMGGSGWTKYTLLSPRLLSHLHHLCPHALPLAEDPLWVGHKSVGQLTQPGAASHPAEEAHKHGILRARRG
jgi:hypothetical protein